MSGFPLAFEQLWALAFGLPLVVWVTLRLVPALRRGTPRARASALLGLLALVAAALAGGQPSLRLPDDRLGVMVVVDRSRSAAEAPEARDLHLTLSDAFAELQPDDRAGIVVFGAEAQTERRAGAPGPVPELSASVPRDGTDIEGGLRRALSELPSEGRGRIVLVSDGLVTEGDVLRAADLAASRGVAIDVVPLTREPRPEVAVEQLRVPRRARPEEPVEIRVVTRASAATPVRLDLLEDGEVVASGRADLQPGLDVLRLRREAPDSGWHRYEVRMTPLLAEGEAAETVDSSSRNNRAGAFMRVQGGARALVTSDEPERLGPLVAVLEEAGYSLDVTGAVGLPGDLGDLALYDLVVLADLSARRLEEARLGDIQRYVRDLGGGLLMAGARHSFGLGGYARTPVEEALPVHLDLRERRDRLSLSMIIAIDRSGSMGMEVDAGRNKLDLANEAAARSALLLAATDRVGVMHVDTSVHWTVPMREVDDPAEIAATVRRASPGGGGIYVDVTMDAAYASLRDEGTQLKHLLLFSDGGDSEQMAGCREKVRAALNSGITTSVISMGVGPDTPELENLSRIGGGRFYIVENLTELPRIFAEETVAATQAALIEETTPVTRGLAHEVTRGVDLSSVPAVDGYTATALRDRASSLLGAGDEDPLLAVWQYGLGRGGAFLTDVGQEFGRPLLRWDGYEPLFAQLARHLARAPERDELRAALRVEAGRARVVVDGIDSRGRTLNHLDLEGAVVGPSGDVETVPIRQVGPGRYEAEVAAERSGPYLVTIREQVAGGEGPGHVVATAAAVRGAGDELRGNATDLALLTRLARLTGGTVRADLRESFRVRPPMGIVHRPITSPLVLVAMLALFLSVLARRLVLPSGRKRRQARSRAAASTGTLEALRSAKRERRERDEEAAAAANETPSFLAELPAHEGSSGRGKVHEPAPVDAPAAADTPADAGEASPAEPATLDQLLARKRRRK